MLVFHVFKDTYLNVIMQIQYIILLKDVWKKNCHEYIYVHNLDFPTKSLKFSYDL